jgi:hypothetical protein
MRGKTRTPLIALVCMGLAIFMTAPLTAQRLDEPLKLISLAKPKTPAEPYKKQYDFEKNRDWFTRHIPIWEIALSPYKGRPDIQYLEIGVFEGRASVWMLENILTHPTSKFTAMDPFIKGGNNVSGEVIKQRFISNVKAAGGEGRTTLIVGYSQVELRKLPLDSFDIIYIDGSHFPADVLEDAVLSWRLLKIGGLMIFDDYALQANCGQPNEINPMPAINAFIILNRASLDLIHCDYQAMIRKRATGR